MLGIDHKWVGNDIFVRYNKPVGIDQLNFFHDIVYSDSRFDNMRLQYVVFNKGVTFTASDMEMDHFSYIEEAAAKSNPHPLYVILVVESDDSRLKSILEGYVEFSKRYNWRSFIFKTNEDALKFISQEKDLSYVDVKSLSDCL